MTDEELIGGVLYDAPDPVAAARLLITVLSAPSLDLSRAEQLGFAPTLVRAAWRSLPRDAISICSACERGAAWVLGRRSASVAEHWELVATLPAGLGLPEGLRRTTAETLFSIVAGAKVIVRIAAPYLDEGGLSILVDAVVAATLRAVTVQVVEPNGYAPAIPAIARAVERIKREGDVTFLQVVKARDGAPWAHLKVLAVDREVAYIGSANMTGAGLIGRNLELGVLVKGRKVEAIDHILDTLIET